MPLAPLRAPLSEAADSMVKATVHEPVGKPGGPGLWKHKGWQLPAYIQHVANDLIESGKDESRAIGMAVGIVKNWAAGHDGKGHKVSATTQAAAAKAVAEWEALKGKAHASSAGKGKVSEEALSLSGEMALKRAARRRLDAIAEALGPAALGQLAEHALGVLSEAAGSSWTPTLVRTASASSETERHDVMDGDQKCGSIAKMPSYAPGRGARYHARAINGQRVGDAVESRPAALDALRKHLEEAPARVRPAGKSFLVAKPASYSGPNTWEEYPTASSARFAAGLPEQPSTPEKNSKVDAVAEVALFDLATLDGLGVPVSVPLAEAFSASELRDFHGRWRGGGSHVGPTLRPRGGTLAKAERIPRTDSAMRYAGGAPRISAATQDKLRSAFTEAERSAPKTRQPDKTVGDVFKRAPGHQSAFERFIDRGAGIGKRLGARVQSTATDSAFAKAKRDVAAHPDVPHVIVAALKGRKRAEEKVRDKYKGDASKLTDVVRGTVLVPHVDDLPKAIEAIRAEMPPGWSITSPENRFVVGGKGSERKVNTGDLNGYRDISLLLRAPDGFQMELQVNTTHMWLAKEAGQGHAIYEEMRSIREPVSAAGRQYTRSEAHKLGKLTEQARVLYGRALTRSTRSVRVIPGGGR